MGMLMTSLGLLLAMPSLTTVEPGSQKCQGKEVTSRRMVCLCGSERRLVLCKGGGLQWRAGNVSPLASWAPACVPAQCWEHWVGPACQQPWTFLSSLGAGRGTVLCLELVAVSSFGECRTELDMLQPWLLGCQWWGPANAGRMWGLHLLPFAVFVPAPGPGSMASGRTALFVPLDALHFLRKQPVVLSGSPSLCLALAPCPGARSSCDQYGDTLALVF